MHEGVKRLFNTFQRQTSGTEFTLDYISLIKHYDAWTGNKLLVYYEDLMFYPASEIKKIGEFLELNKDDVERFLSNLPEEKEKSIKNYEPGSQTKGKVGLHLQRIPPQLKLDMDRHLKEKWPEIWEEYLKRYEEQ